MKNQTPTREVFKIKFSKVIILLCVAIFALCGVGIGLSVWRIIRYGVNGFGDALKSPFLIAVCAFCIVLVVCVLIKSQYVVDERYFITQFGFIKSKFEIKEITSLLLDAQLKKLTIYFGEQFTVISVSPDWNERFVRALLAVNPDIEYSFTFSDPPENKKNSDDKKE